MTSLYNTENVKEESLTGLSPILVCNTWLKWHGLCICVFSHFQWLESFCNYHGQAEKFENLFFLKVNMMVEVLRV